MDWFYLLFPPLMTAAPLAMVWFADRTLPPAPDTAFRRWGKFLLPAFIVAAVAAYLSALASLGREHALTRVLFYLYFPAWGLAMPLTIRPNPNFGEDNFNRTERTASLKPRHRESPISRRWWLVAWSTALVGSGFVLMIGFLKRPSASSFVAATMIAAFSVFSVWLAQRTLPLGLEEPEPLGTDRSIGLQREYEAFRNRRVWTMFAMFGIAMPIMLLAFAGATVLASPGGGPAIGIVGGIVGSVFGLIGAAVGVAADMKRKRLAAMLERAEAR
jgi:hypothetical protein